MATTRKTVYTHTCDLCGEVQDEEDLRHLYGEVPSRQRGVAFNRQSARPKADICDECQARPVSEVFAFLDGKAEGGPRG